MDQGIVVEILDRARRIETRLVRLCTALNVDPTKDKVRVAAVQCETGKGISISGLDVSYGDLLDFCRKSGIKGAVEVWHKGTLLGTMQVGGSADARA